MKIFKSHVTSTDQMTVQQKNLDVKNQNWSVAVADQDLMII